MARLSDLSAGAGPQKPARPNSAKGIGLKLVEIGQDLEARKATEPRAALQDAAQEFEALGFGEFASAANRLANLDEPDLSTAAGEMAGATVHMMTKLALAMHQAQIGGHSAQIDPSLDAHRPNWAKHL